MSDVEREIAWKRQGKGNGLRWLILRDIVAGVSLMGMNLETLQDYMLMLRGVSWNTSRVMVNELARSRSIEQIGGEDAGVFFWTATKVGVAVFCRTRKHIPARIALAVSITNDAKKSDPK